VLRKSANEPVVKRLVRPNFRGGEGGSQGGAEPSGAMSPGPAPKEVREASLVSFGRSGMDLDFFGGAGIRARM
jgi:hypothetical protein